MSVKSRSIAVGKHSHHPKIRSRLQSLDLKHHLGVGWTTYEATLKSHFATQLCYLVPGVPCALICWWPSWCFWVRNHGCSLSMTVYPGEKPAVWLDAIPHLSRHLIWGRQGSLGYLANFIYSTDSWAIQSWTWLRKQGADGSLSPLRP